MKTSFYLPVFVALATLLSFQACTDSDPLISPKVQSGGSIEPRSSLTDIQAYGVADAGDFDVLRSNNIYPFNEITSTQMDDYQDDLVFCENQWRGSTGYDVSGLLTQNQFMIWHQIALRRNITLNTNGASFASPIFGETPYSARSGWGSAVVSWGYKMYQEENPDTCEWECPPGNTTCIEPF